MQIRIEQALHCHDHSRRTKAALKGLVLEKHLLHRIEFAVLCEAFDGCDSFVFDVAREREAGADRFAVN
jgi:hypothetical protein